MWHKVTMSHNATQCNTKWHNVTPSDTEWHKVTHTNNVTHCDTLWHIVSQCNTKWQCDTMLHNVTPSDTKCNNVTQSNNVAQCDTMQHQVTQCDTKWRCLASGSRRTHVDKRARFMSIRIRSQHHYAVWVCAWFAWLVQSGWIVILKSTSYKHAVTVWFLIGNLVVVKWF